MPPLSELDRTATDQRSGQGMCRLPVPLASTDRCRSGRISKCSEHRSASPRQYGRSGTPYPPSGTADSCSVGATPTFGNVVRVNVKEHARTARDPLRHLQMLRKTVRDHRGMYRAVDEIAAFGLSWWPPCRQCCPGAAPLSTPARSRLQRTIRSTGPASLSIPCVLIGGRASDRPRSPVRRRASSRL